ncbi:MAG: ABC transporter [Hamadaea sp.]|uniref:GTPase n=1 Tax=Hamadaea sp. TaxID=2024425 RepID=UPI00180C2FE4|nr:GTPase [Hamadaea sp.]NUR71045.1 ABC transporter [Hamadaea sp.]NUT24010.1 ABC transporter [Hamadaea sp.]
MKLDSVVDRVGALREFVETTSPYLPADELAPAQAVVDRAGERLALSRAHTVVALAGATGSGKSTLFNRLAGVELSPAGRRRPTTGEAYACVWGSGADELLDWLDVVKRYGVPAGELDGLVLLDLPDYDSVAASHRVEVDRLLRVVDLIVWVLHPQKYADKVVHRQYLEQFAAHKDVTVVALHQADLLSPEDLRECLSDLDDLLRADGLAGVPVVATSAVGPPGLDPLVTQLTGAVRRREAALRRLDADVTTVSAQLAPLVAAPAPEVPKASQKALVDALAHAAGVPLVASATEQAYVHRARKATGWPFARWVRRFRADPLRRLRVGSASAGSTVGATSIGPAAPAAQAEASLAVRQIAEDAGRGLAPPWQDALRTAARSRRDDLPDALDVAVARTDLKLDRNPRWWRTFGLLQWIAALAVVAGVLWLLVRYVMFALALPEIPMPEVGRVPLPTFLLFAGLLVGLGLALLVRPIVRLAARRKGRRAYARLRSAVVLVADSHVLTPVRGVLDAYARARSLLGTKRERVGGVG